VYACAKILQLHEFSSRVCDLCCHGDFAQKLFVLRFLQDRRLDASLKLRTALLRPPYLDVQEDHLAAQHSLDFLPVVLYDSKCNRLGSTIVALRASFAKILFDLTPKPSGKKHSSPQRKVGGAGGGGSWPAALVWGCQ